MNLENLQNLIEENRNNGINLGNCDNSPAEDWIAAAEEQLGLTFPPSYIWFLKNYGGGEIYGDEIYSIYELPFEEAFGGDVVFQTLADRKSGLVSETEVSLCSTDYGELFVFESFHTDDEGEYKIYRKLGKEKRLYAEKFSEFLFKKINEALPSQDGSV